ncbi:MAG: hypothetical protein UIG59_03440, partial [Acutalibacteraceae bacterium]|nr:hypothetical protein [Acutalibacteraceae bacterium]
KYIYKNGDTFLGIFKNGIAFEGEGRVDFTSGNSYNGTFSNAQPHGHGKYTYAKDSRLDYYEGDFVDGKRSGKGKLFYKSGTIYDGEWKDNVRHGMGKMIFQGTSIDYFIGEFENDEPKPYGTIFYKNGLVYEGMHREYSLHGEGKLYSADNKNEYYQGKFESGIFVSGVKQNADGSRYEGALKDGKFHGQGEYIYSNHRYTRKYKGEWMKGDIIGLGTMEYINGDRYEGEWDQNRFDGLGTYHFRNGDTYEGIWREGYFYYKGKLTLSDGTVFEGKFSYDNTATGNLICANGIGCEVVRGEITDGKIAARVSAQIKELVQNHKLYFDHHGYKSF